MRRASSFLSLLCVFGLGCEQILAAARDAGADAPLERDGAPRGDAETPRADGGARCPLRGGGPFRGIMVPGTSPTRLAEGTAAAQNTDGLARASLTTRQSIAVSANGTVGAITQDARGVTYHPVSPRGAPFVIDTRTGGLLGASLFFDGSDRPVVIGLARNDTLVEIRSPRDGMSEPRSIGDAPLRANLWVDAQTVVTNGRVDRFDVVNDGAGVSVSHTSAPSVGGSYRSQRIPVPNAARDTRFAVGPDGTVHLVFTDTQRPCDPCDLNLYYARLQNNTVQRETALRGVWGPPEDVLYTGFTVAVDAMNRPVIAAQEVHRGPTGSVTRSSLKFVVRLEDGRFCVETVAAQGEGFQGEGGPGFTGDQTAITFAPNGQPFIGFLDRSVWHDAMGRENAVSGQLRVATTTADGWRTATLLAQPGRTASPNPLHAATAPGLVVAGNTLYGVTTRQQWATDSIYNLREVPVAQQAEVATATVP